MNLKRAGIFLLIVTVAISGYYSIAEFTLVKANGNMPVKVKWFSDLNMWDPPQTWSTDARTVQGQITKNTGLTFDMDIPPGDGDMKLNLILASSKALPDVMSILSQYQIGKLIKSGKVWEIDEFLKKYDPKSHLLKDFPDDIKKELIKRDGGWYVYPSHMNSKDARKIWKPSGQYYINNLQYRNNNGIMVNTDLMKKAGLKLEDFGTEAGLLAAYKKVSNMKLTIGNKGVIPLLVDGKGYIYSTLQTIRTMFGGMEVDKNGMYRDMLFSKENKHACEFLNKLYRYNYFDANQLILDNSAIKVLIKSGRVLTFIGNMANTGFSEPGIGNWLSPGPVRSSTGERPVLGKSQKAGTGWMQTMISKKTRQPEKLAKWISYMSSKQGLIRCIYGVKGKDYKLNSKGLIVQTQEGINKAKYYTRTGLSAYWPFHYTSFSQSVVQAPTDMVTPESKAMLVQCAYGRSKNTFLYDNSAVIFPVNYIPTGSKLDRMRFQANYYSEMQIAKIVLAGSQSIFREEYGEMIRQLKILGLDKVDAVLNRYVMEQNKENGFILKAVN